MLEQQFNQ